MRLVKLSSMVLLRKAKQLKEANMSNMKRWLREHGISYAQLAKQLNQSQPSISQKVNLKTCWQFDDCRRLRDVYGLSSDFVQDLVPYEAKFAESVRDHEEVSV